MVCNEAGLGFVYLAFLLFRDKNVLSRANQNDSKKVTDCSSNKK